MSRIALKNVVLGGLDADDDLLTIQQMMNTYQHHHALLHQVLQPLRNPRFNSSQNQMEKQQMGVELCQVIPTTEDSSSLQQAYKKQGGKTPWKKALVRKHTAQKLIESLGQKCPGNILWLKTIRQEKGLLWLGLVEGLIAVVAYHHRQSSQYHLPAKAECSLECPS